MSVEQPRSICGGCGEPTNPTVLSCPRCETPLHPSQLDPTRRGGPLGLRSWDESLAEIRAPRLTTPDQGPNEPIDRPHDDEEDSWVDIPISIHEPVKAALIRMFLAENDFSFEESRRFVSVPIADGERLVERTVVWAFSQDLPDDARHADSLASTQREIGTSILVAIKTAAHANLAKLRPIADALDETQVLDAPAAEAGPGALGENETLDLRT